jgi:hypothetical protein
MISKKVKFKLTKISFEPTETHFDLQLEDRLQKQIRSFNGMLMVVQNQK